MILDPTLSEWLNLLFRWTHVFAGIMWVGTTYYFTLQAPWETVSKSALSEMPTAVEAPVNQAYGDARELVVPRYEGDRISLTFPPDKIFYVAPGRLAADADGNLIRKGATDKAWTTVEVRDFRAATVFDRLQDWLRGAFNA